MPLRNRNESQQAGSWGALFFPCGLWGTGSPRHPSLGQALSIGRLRESPYGGEQGECQYVGRSNRHQEHAERHDYPQHGSILLTIHIAVSISLIPQESASCVKDPLKPRGIRRVPGARAPRCVRVRGATGSSLRRVCVQAEPSVVKDPTRCALIAPVLSAAHTLCYNGSAERALGRNVARMVSVGEKAAWGLLNKGGISDVDGDGRPNHATAARRAPW